MGDSDHIVKIRVGSDEVKFCNNVKCLGFYFNNDFSTKHHTNNIKYNKKGEFFTLQKIRTKNG